jgi:hypothetical protein
VFDIYQNRLDRITTIHAAEMQADMEKAAYWATTSPTVVKVDITYSNITACGYPHYALRDQDATIMTDNECELQEIRICPLDAISVQYFEMNYVEKSVEYAGELYSFSIYDLTGKVLQYQQGLTNNRIDIATNNDWAPGTYIYRLINDSQTTIKSGEIVKS